MVNYELYKKLLKYDFEKLFKNKKYVYFTKGNYNLNIIGVRSKGNNVTNAFDDYLVVLYTTNVGRHCRKIYKITTDPGITYMKNPTAEKGTAILVPGQYRSAYKFGLHKGKYKALVQNKTVKVYRDNNKDNVYDWNPSTLDEGFFGINIHKAGNVSNKIDNWSAGCQVFAYAEQYNSFIRLCEEQIKAGCGNTFTYTLLKEEELI